MKKVFIDDPRISNVVFYPRTIKIPEEMTNEERMAILGKIATIKSKILEDIKQSQDESFVRLN